MAKSNFFKKLWDEIGVTYEGIKEFAPFLGFDVPEMIRFSGWFVAILAAFVVIPYLLFSGSARSVYVDDYQPTTVAALQSGAIYDTPKGYQIKDGKAQKIADVRRGDSLRVLAYCRYSFAFQVETPSGNRGFVRANLIADSMIVVKRINVDNDYLEKGERVLLTAITPPNKKKKEYSEKTTVRRGSETFTFTSGELFPIMAFGTPLYKSDEMAIVTPRWISHHFTVDIAKKAEIDKEWYGYATTVKKSGNDIVALYNFKVNDEARDKEHKGLIVTYRDGIVHHYDYASSESMGWILSIMPFANDIQSLSMTARMTTSPITTKAEFNTVADITEEESGITKWIHENFFNWKLPTWLSVIIALVVGIIALIVFVFYIHCVLMLVPAIVQFVGYIPFLPNFIYRIIITCALILGAELLYFFAGGLNWFLVILVVAYLWFQWKNWMKWITFNRCSQCGHMYTLVTDDYRDGGTSYYDKVNYRVTSRGGKEIDRTETSREHRKIVTVHEDLHCSNCGAAGTYTHVNDMQA